MSGIAGFVSLDGSPASDSDLTPMVEAIAYRGPDGVDVSVVGEAALAQLWLRTTPQSLGARAPVTSAGGALIVGDVRLDERLDLARVLPFDPTTTDDLEIVALAFDRWGGGSFAHLRGDFAIAAWVPGDRRLFLARDSFGVKPLFYARRGQRVFFGSQPIAILGHPDVAGAPDETRIACELMGVSPPAERTFFEGISRVVPAYFIAFSQQGERTERHWDLRDDLLALLHPRDYADGFRERLLGAVSDRLRLSGEPAFDLTGGLDSTSVVGASTKLIGPDASLRTYSMAIFDDSDGDSRLSALAARELGTEHTVVSIDDAYNRTTMRERFGSPDSPGSIDGPMYQTLSWPLARADGAVAMFGGMHGDTVVGHGYQALLEMVRAGHFRRLARETALLQEHSIMTRRSAIRSWVVRPLLPLGVVDRLRADRRRTASGWGPEPVGAKARCAPLGATVPSGFALSGDGQFSVRQAIRSLMESPLIVEYLEDLDIAAARVGIEPRHAYCDRRIVEFSYAIPTEAHLRDGWSRWFQREAIDGLVPDEVRWRPDKGGFFPAFRSALLRPEWSEVIELCRDGGRCAGLIDRNALHRTVRAASGGDNTALANLFRFRRLDRWLDQHGFEV